MMKVFIIIQRGEFQGEEILTDRVKTCWTLESYLWIIFDTEHENGEKS